MKTAQCSATLSARGNASKSRFNLVYKNLQNESGSLSILIITLFLLVLLLSILTIDVSDNFLAKRELLNIGEVAITSAAHNLAADRYYSGSRNADDSEGDGYLLRVPIDCNAAQLSFEDEIRTSNLRGVPISINEFDCVDDEVSASISATIPVAVNLPLGIGTSTTDVIAEISATSIIDGYR